MVDTQNKEGEPIYFYIAWLNKELLKKEYLLTLSKGGIIKTN